MKSIAKGSAADLSRKIRVNDQVIEVDGRPLQGYSNHQAVELLRSTGKVGVRVGTRISDDVDASPPLSAGAGSSWSGAVPG